MDLDLLDCLGRVNLVLQLNFIGLIYLFKVILEGQKNLSYNWINTVHVLCREHSFRSNNWIWADTVLVQRPEGIRGHKIVRVCLVPWLHMSLDI